MPAETNNNHLPQLQLFTTDAQLEERLAAMAAQSGDSGSPYKPDPELDAIQMRNLEDGAGFTPAQAEKAVTQMDPRDIVSEGTKRAIELRRQRRAPKTGRARTNQIARLSPSAKRRRDDRRELKQYQSNPES